MTILTPPPPRYSGIISELPTSSELVMYGGKTTAELWNGYTSINGILNDTWTFASGQWTNVSSGYSGNTIANPTPARYNATACFDGYNVVMNGGSNRIRNITNTSTYNTGGWTQVAITDTINLNPNPLYNEPNLLSGATISYQSGTGIAYMFGGNCSSFRSPSLELWGWDGYSASPSYGWTYLTPSPTTSTNSPSGRYYACSASSSNTTYLFGGKNYDGASSQFWEYTGGNWSQINTGQTPGYGAPQARYGASCSWHAATSTFLMVGGIGQGNIGFLDECWGYNSGTWTQIASPIPALAFGQMAYLTASTTTILFGGLGYSQCYGSTYAFNGTSWSQLG